MIRKLLALDPGGTTGVAHFLLRDDWPLELRYVEQWPGGVNGFIEAWMNGVRDFNEPDIIVAESFRLDGRTPKPDITPARIEGALLALANTEPIFQPNTFKSHAPDALLKSAGLWQKGMPHACDAIRHAIAWAKTHRHLPTIRALWPPMSTPEDRITP